MMKKSVVIFYIFIFWIIIPFVLVVSSIWIDSRVGITPVNISPVLSWAITIISALLLAISIMQFVRNTGLLPISAYPPGHIVRFGLYAYWRHPIYLFYTMLLIGISLIWRSPAMIHIVMPVFIVVAATYTYIEENNLLKRFGNDYKAYQEQTGLIIPRFHVILMLPFCILSKMFFPIKVVNKHNVPKKAPFFLVANHRNYLDPFLISFTLPYKVHYITTFEMFRKPFTALFFRLLGCIPKKRYLYDSKTVKQIIQILKNGSVIGIFPEGERSYSGVLLELKNEPMKLFKKRNEIPIIPVSISGDYIMWPRWGKGWRRCPITITYHSMIMVKETNTHDQISDMISTSIRPDDRGVATDFKKRAEKLEYFIYRCPSCRKFDTLASKNDRLSCHECGYELSVRSDYSLEEKPGGTILSILKLYESVCVDPSDLLAVSTVNDEIAISNYCQFFKEEGIKMNPQFIGRIFLYKDKLIVRSSNEHTKPTEIPVGDILSATIEGNRKLQVYDNGRKQLYQFIFESESAKKWQDYIAEAHFQISGEYPILR